VKIVKYRGFAEPGLRQKFAFCFAVVFSMAALVTSAAIADDHLSQDHRRYFSIAILVLLSSLLLVPLPWPSECVGSDGGKHEEVVPLLAGSVAKTVATTGGLAPLPELSSLEMLRTRECWCAGLDPPLCFVFGVGFRARPLRQLPSARAAETAPLRWPGFCSGGWAGSREGGGL
jgi:hypothetical protein